MTEAGQTIVKQIAAELETEGAHVIEIDTDGVYFKPPEEVKTEADELAYVEKIGATLPPGIRLAHDGSYAAMLSLEDEELCSGGTERPQDLQRLIAALPRRRALWAGLSHRRRQLIA